MASHRRALGLLACGAALAAACHRAPPRAHDDANAAAVAHHEDLHDRATAPAVLALDVTIGGDHQRWDADAFARVPRLPGTNHAGDARDVWSLRALATTLAGPTARVTAVVGDGQRVAIAPDAWADGGRTPILHTTRRGTLKFRWADAAGTWADALVRDVTGLELER
ncbi:MAG TPA: hypothetical protein VHE35_14025 [Kofleriaceae bacterium]|nr:hypothetical protein [Kofleriaceae bacterium]